MKRVKQCLFSLVAVIGICSCSRVSFLYPISERKEDRVFKKELLGEWKERGESDDNTNIIDTMINEDSSLMYSITIIDRTEHDFGDTSHMIAGLYSLQNKLFMLISTDFMHEKNRQIGVYNAAMILPSYQIIRIYKLTNDSLQIGQIDGDTLVKLTNEKRISLKHEIIEEGDILITEKPKDLQRKLLEMEKFPGLYFKTMFYRRKSTQ